MPKSSRVPARLPRFIAPSLLVTVLVTALAIVPTVAQAAPVRVVASDARGVTLQLSLGVWGLSPPDAQGRVQVNTPAGAHLMSVPGRPLLPAWSATLAVPNDANPSVRVLSSEGEQARSGARLVIAGKPVFRDDPASRLGEQPGVEAVEPVVDGVWPTSSVSLTTPFGFRGRKLLAVELRPFRYDESGARVSSPLTLTVRVDFNRPPGAAAMAAGVAAPDRHVDGALEASVLNWEQARPWRVAPTGYAGAVGGPLFGSRPAAGRQAVAFDAQPEVRVKLTESALYRLAFDELELKLYPAGVPVADVSVHRHEFREGQSPPYDTVELPCEVEDANGNGVFDSGDGVWVWARTWAERSNASVIRRFWGDAEVVFVTSQPGGALRVAQRPGWNNVAALTPLASYPFKRHYERDLAPIMPFVATPSDTSTIGIWHWTDLSLYFVRPDTIRIETNDLDTSKAVSTLVRWVGRRSDNHFMWAAFKNGLNQITTFTDSVGWFGKTAVTRAGTLPGSALTEGNTNFFRQWGKSLSGPPNQIDNFLCIAGLDWFELTYWRRFRAVQDYVRFNSENATGDIQMQVGGFSSDSVRVYDVTNPDLPVRITLDPAHVAAGAGGVGFEFQDVAAAGTRREYVAASIQTPAAPALGPHVPPSSAYSVVTHNNVWANSAGDYLLVVPEAFAAAVPPLEALRRSQGLTVVRAPVESIYDEFDGGRHSATAIQRFASYAYQNWDARFLLLVGDGTLDPNGSRRLSGLDWIPILPTPGTVGTSEGSEIVPSDNRYGFITGNANPNVVSDIVVPELMVGRLTVNSLADASTVINKLIAYETVTQPDAWRRNILLSTDDAFSGETTFGGGPATSGYCHRSYEELFVSINQQMQAAIDGDTGLPGLNVEQFNLRSYLPDERFTIGTFDTCRVDRDETRLHTHSRVTPILLGKLNAGQLMWNYQGHANEFVLSHEDLWINSGSATGDDAQSLRNDGKPFVFAAFSCHANMFARPEHQLNAAVGASIGEDLLGLANGRGAVASWASVSFEVVPRPTGHVNIELMHSLFVDPPSDEFLGAGERGARVVLGEAVLTTLLRYLPTTQSYAPERGLSVSYTLLGDPATRISIGRPLGTLLANGQPVPVGTPLRLHTLGDTLRLDATIVSNVRIDSVALYRNTGSGDVPLSSTEYTLTPPFPDTGAAGLHGGRRFDFVHHGTLEARTYDYALVVRDRNGLVQRTALQFELGTVLFRGGQPIGDGDEVAPGASLSLLVQSPRPILDPQNEITLSLNGLPMQAFTAVPNPGDNSGREWILSWAHADYPIDSYELIMSVVNGGSVTRSFSVTLASGQLAFKDLIPFPNPFENDGTRFSFLLLGGEDADVKLHVFSQSGRSIYTNSWRALAPGYHQLAWDGRDAESDELANGVYFFRLVASTPGGASTQQFGRLVKLRRPRHIEEALVP
jgi:hypothetical protein